MIRRDYSNGRLMYDALLRNEFPDGRRPRRRTGKPQPKVRAFTPTDRYVRVGKYGVHHLAVAGVTVEAAGESWTGYRFLCGGHTVCPLGALPEMERVCDDCALADEPAVYVYADALGQPLYVGSTGRVLQRMKQHGWGAPWWPLAAAANATFLSDLPTARGVELDTIRSLQPLYNIRGKAAA